MNLIGDAIAEISREAHAREPQTMNRIFADAKTTDKVMVLLRTIG
jgi:hypothetical protein